MNDNCSHTETVWVDHYREDMDGDRIQEGGWEDRSTTRDLNIHQYQCTRCKKVFNYCGGNDE